MSNHLAIATVTEGLRYIVENALSVIDSGAGITVTRPDLAGKDSSTHVNIYLYQVTPNAAWRNVDLPTRRADGGIAARPTAALDLHYIISFYGDETDGEMEAQRLLGGVISALHARPLLTREVIEDVLAATSLTMLAESDLADQIESVRITPSNLNLEELSKLWSVFFQTPYALSVACQCSAVLIEAPVTATQALPPRTAGIRAVPFSRATITEIINEEGKTVPVTAASTLLIKGSGLRGENVAVRIGDVEAQPASVTDREVTVDLSDGGALDTAALRAGVLPAQLVYRVALDPDDPVDSLRVGWTSNPFPVVLRPQIDDAQQTDDDEGNSVLDVTVIPDVGPRQRAALLLNRLDPPPGEAPGSYVIDASLRSGDVPSDVLRFPLAGVEAGNYLVRVQIDGAESPLETDPNGAYNGPAVEVTA